LAKEWDKRVRGDERGGDGANRRVSRLAKVSSYEFNTNLKTGQAPLPDLSSTMSFY